MKDLEQVTLHGEQYYKIKDSDSMRPFFMSIVSDANHWMFISSNGGLTAGRKNSEFALFPYYTDDKITESVETTGSKSIFRLEKEGKTVVWEPFSVRNEGRFTVSRNLYKSIYGNQVVFEETNEDLGLSFRYRWSSSAAYGFVRTSTLTNNSEEAITVALVDGLQNILPYGVGSDLQRQSSNLADAYKRSELHAASGLGIFALSAIIVDKAEPSEALKANTVWSVGLDGPTHLLSALQLESFRQGDALRQETDVKGEKGAYLLNKEVTLGPKAAQSWIIVADVNQSRVAVEKRIQELGAAEELAARVAQDIAQGTEELIALTAASDGLQLTADERGDTRHFSNVMFNIMRGGIFDNNYQIEKWDFEKYLSKGNKAVSQQQQAFIAALPEVFSLLELRSRLKEVDDPALQRLAIEYLPLKFSRRHGDPSRPWNKFSINTHNEEDGSKILDYQGNWRDIFQNWEALAHSYPEFMEGMIFKFLNASTFDGYNPYRVVKDGFDWETIEKDDPWSYIGYWGDHQIIYLLKFLEFTEKHQPGALASYFAKDLFVYANVPYRIKSYQDILKNPKDTVDFDHKLDTAIRESRKEMGTDGALLTDQSGEIYRVNFIEKILATLLAKTSNFIPEGGIWMNTQRPEWNDANNALVGNGVSMVTLYYMRRFLTFFDGILSGRSEDSFELSIEVTDFYEQTLGVLEKFAPLLKQAINDQDRKAVLDGLGEAASHFRNTIYGKAFSGAKRSVGAESLQQFIRLSLSFFDHTIEANHRTDDLYHAYNLMTVKGGGVSISYLDEMLEGQVAVLSSGYLNAAQSLAVLDGMKGSALFRPDQYSYLLYPAKELPGFLQKNNVPAAAVKQSALLSAMVADGDGGIIQQDVNGGYHFNGNFKNAGDLANALSALAGTKYADQAAAEQEQLAAVFEEVFNHKAFTGRSGTFFGYEGLGSIYWHMVSKLRYAVVECCRKAVREAESAETIGRLLEHYYEIAAGIGVHKSPELYGAFPTDPYSHTPGGKGAQQPGMTGQVKEDLLSRFGELGVTIKEGQLSFMPTLLRKEEFLTRAETFRYIDLAGEKREIALPAGSLAFTWCQIPVIYAIGDAPTLRLQLADGREQEQQGVKLTTALSEEVFGRSGKITSIFVTQPAGVLR
ncbi:hypothetical protein [Neolewinella agarilytica]|uniref:Cellobiose phosphorylase n=1 Tax=Neolewinella agarilytica TaxID=478744 RepID=A0A1H9FTS7_9BACT|nr:hypothetical protein [Neolewinella agarilytica]SEQ41340.1 hypothetical protein SAMN05444359_109100 [Neolewinella agarilytica]